MDKLVWVIRDEGGNFITFFQGNYFMFSGICPGFTFYDNEETAKQEWKQLNKDFLLDYMKFCDIPKGKRLFVDLYTYL